jgi:hypothetical protein
MRFFVITFISLFLTTKIFADDSLEYKVKAAYLLNFTKFTEWPAEDFADTASPLVICVLSTESFKNTLQETVANAKHGTRAIKIVEIKTPQEASGQCHAVYIAHPFMKMTQEFIKLLHQKSILTIGDDESFYSNGGMISFVVYDETVQFSVNLGVANEVGLRLSSRMLALAKRVIPVTSRGGN